MWHNRVNPSAHIVAHKQYINIWARAQTQEVFVADNN